MKQQVYRVRIPIVQKVTAVTYAPGVTVEAPAIPARDYVMEASSFHQVLVNAGRAEQAWVAEPAPTEPLYPVFDDALLVQILAECAVGIKLKS